MNLNFIANFSAWQHTAWYTHAFRSHGAVRSASCVNKAPTAEMVWQGDIGEFNNTPAPSVTCCLRDWESSLVESAILSDVFWGQLHVFLSAFFRLGSCSDSIRIIYRMHVLYLLERSGCLWVQRIRCWGFCWGHCCVRKNFGLSISRRKFQLVTLFRIITKLPKHSFEAIFG